MLGELAKSKNSFTYVSWGCGSGKTTCMLELGHIIGLRLLGQKVKSAKVKLLVANADLVAFHMQLFAAKQFLKDPRLTFEWESIDAFKMKLNDD